MGPLGARPAAVELASTYLLGTLGSAILIDEDTTKVHLAELDQAVTDLPNGSVAFSSMPPMVFLSPYLTWGGSEEGQPFV